MKNTQLLYGLLLLTAAAGCNKEGGDCDKPQYGITLIQPTANPPGYEVVIGGPGLTPDTEIFFGTEPAADQRWEDNLGVVIAEVPGGITGAVDITAREGDCSARQEFEVFSAYPGNVPQSPVVFIVPAIVGSLPPGVGIGNLWRNVFDEDHFIGIFDFEDPQGVFDTDCNLNCSQEVHNSNQQLGSFQNPNPITGTYDLDEKRLEITVDRTPNGGQKETYDGIFIDPKIASVQHENQQVILLTSRKDGRQLVIQYVY